MDEPDIKLLIQTKYTINNRLYYSKGKKFGHVVQSDVTVCRENDYYFPDCPTPRYITN